MTSSLIRTTATSIVVLLGVASSMSANADYERGYDRQQYDRGGYAEQYEPEYSPQPSRQGTTQRRDARMNLTYICQYTSGPMEGTEQDFSSHRYVQFIPPIRVGGPCSDGRGSFGFGVPMD